jgi:hypothetical protein
MGTAVRAPMHIPAACRIQGRLDSSDILQEAYIDVFRNLPPYVEATKKDLSNLRGYGEEFDVGQFNEWRESVITSIRD